MEKSLLNDNTFVEDQDWKDASNRFQKYIKDHKNSKTLFLEIGVGYNTPSIIKYNFWNLTDSFKDAFYISINNEKESIPDTIKWKALSIKENIYSVIKEIKF